MGVRRFAPGYTWVCGMNFQNFFQRIESLHQRTLIRILYEFFFLKFIEQVDRKGELNEIFFMLIGIEREDRWIGSTQVD